MYSYRHSVVSFFRLLLTMSLLAGLVACSRTGPGLTPTPTTSSTGPTKNNEPGPQLDPVEEGPVTITFASYEYERPLYESLIEEFNKQYPDITVQFTPLPEFGPQNEEEEYNYYRTLATTADTSLTYNSGPELSYYFRDLLPLIESDPDFQPDDFWPRLLSACEDMEGRVLGVPVSVQVSGIFYDEAAFKEAGVPLPAPSWTWEDFRKAAAGLAYQKGDQIRYGFAEQSYTFGSLLNPLIVQYLVANGGEIDPESLAQEFQWYLDLAESKAILPIRDVSENWNEEWQKWQEMFKSEYRPAMWADALTAGDPGFEWSSSINDPYASLAIRNFGFSPFPISEERGGSNTNMAWSECASISAGSAHPRAAWTWIKFLSHHWLVRDRNELYNVGKAPARQSVAEQVGYWDAIPAKAVEALRYSLSHTYVVGQYMFEQDAIYRSIMQATSGKTELVAALEEAAGQLSQTAQPTPDPRPIVVATPRPPLPDDALVIKFFANSNNNRESEAVKTLAENYQQAHPGTVIKISNYYEFSGQGDIIETLAESFDCFVWYKPYQIEFSVESMLNLGSLVASEPASFLADYEPSMVNAYRFNGELYGLPVTIQPQIMAYNADLLARRGLQPPSNDWTFEDFIALATAVASTAEGDESYGFQYGIWDELLLNAYNIPWADLESDPPVAYFDSPEMLEHLEWVAELAKSGALLVNTEDNYMDIFEATRDGKLAFWMSTAGEENSMFAYGPASENNYKIGAAPMPVLPTNSKMSYLSMERGFFISKNASDPKMCWGWIKYLSEQPTALGGVPARKSVANSPAWEATLDAGKADVYRLAASRAAEQAMSETQYNQTVWPLYNWRNQATRAALTGGNIEQALIEAQQTADTYLACIVGVDITGLKDEELHQEIVSCAKQADPNGQW